MTTTSMLIRDLPIETKQGLRAMAEAANSSMEAEARRILKTAVARAQKAKPAAQPPSMLSLADRVHARFARFGAFTLDIPPRGPDRPLPDFSGPEYAWADEPNPAPAAGAPVKTRRKSGS